MGRERVARLWPDRLTHLFTVSGIVADRAYHPVRQTLVGHDTLRLSRRRPPREERRRRDRGVRGGRRRGCWGVGTAAPLPDPGPHPSPCRPVDGYCTYLFPFHPPPAIADDTASLPRLRRLACDASLATKRRDVDTSRHRGDRRRHGPQERASLLALFSCGDTSPGGLCPCMSPTVAWRGAFSRGRAVMAQGKTRQEPPQRKWLLTINYVGGNILLRTDWDSRLWLAEAWTAAPPRRAAP